MIVMKFGGTSIKDAEGIKNTVQIINKSLRRRPIVVASAIKGITDLLVESAKNKSLKKAIEEKHYEILDNLNLEHSLIQDETRELKRAISSINRLNPKKLDLIQSHGERFSSKILSRYLNKCGIRAEPLNAYEIGMITDSEFGRAEPLPEAQVRIKRHLQNKKILPVITGFIGRNKSGEITTLGRNGSDYTATVIGAALNVDEIQIWTDVDGIMSADPQIVRDGKIIEEISFAEASELAYFGARVLHPKTLLPAMTKNIPVRILNAHNPCCKGTLLLSQIKKSKPVVKAIVSKKGIYLVSIISVRMLNAWGFLSRLFKVFEKYHINVDMVATSEVSVSATIDNTDNLSKLIKDLKQIAEVKVEYKKAIIAIIGRGIKYTLGVQGEVFNTLAKNKIHIEMISQGASEINVSFIVDEKDVDKAVRCLHKKYFT